MNFDYQYNLSFDDRFNESDRILKKYPDRIPIICEIHKSSSNILKLDKSKYLVPKDLTFSQFIYVIRKRLKIDSSKAIFIFIHNIIPSTNSLIDQLYTTFKDKDGFLYCSISEEQVFG